MMNFEDYEKEQLKNWKIAFWYYWYTFYFWLKWKLFKKI